MNEIYVLIVAQVLSGAQMQEFSSLERCETARLFVERSIKGEPSPEQCRSPSSATMFFLACTTRTFVSFEAKCLQK